MKWAIEIPLASFGVNQRSSPFWDSVVERVEKRLDGLKRAFLSRGGRYMVIQSVLSSLPVYYLYLFSNPDDHRCRFLYHKLITQKPYLTLMETHSSTQ